MHKVYHYSLIGVVIGLSCTYMDFVCAQGEAGRRSKHFDIVTRSMKIVLDGFKHEQVERCVSREGEFGNSWRLYFTLAFPYDDADSDRADGNQSWRSHSLDEWDDRAHNLFTVDKATDFPRDKRYTHIMAVKGAGTAFEFIEKRGLADLRRTAPDAVVLVEVANSTMPWMQAGDLEVDQISGEISSSNKLTIGSSLGYDEFGVGFADGSVWILDSSVPFASLQKFLTVENARKHDRQRILGKYVVRIDGASPDDRTGGVNVK